MRGKGIGLHRLRAGSYRVVYRLQAEKVCVLVIRIGHRSEVYMGWEGL
jgi:mRNA interferase RelE/StbE